MSDWALIAKTQQTQWKSTTSTLDEGAREDGTVFEKQHGRAGQINWQESEGTYPHCLPRSAATQNLLPGIRQEALSRFQRFGISWDSETPRAGLMGNAGPTTSLLSSQIQCVNALLSVELTPNALLERVEAIVPGTRKLLPIRHLNQAKAEGLVAFEWVGRKNYLNEAVHGERARHPEGTSADALIVSEREGGRRTRILIDWTYAEPAEGAIEPISQAGIDRRHHYREAYEGPTSPFGAHKPSIEGFLEGPHFRLLRLALLAQAMREAKEHGVDQMVLLMITPAANQALRHAVPEALRPHGQTLDTLWATLLPGPEVRFMWQDSAGWLSATPELAERYGAPSA